MEDFRHTSQRCRETAERWDTVDIRTVAELVYRIQFQGFDILNDEMVRMKCKPRFWAILREMVSKKLDVSKNVS